MYHELSKWFTGLRASGHDELYVSTCSLPKKHKKLDIHFFSRIITSHPSNTIGIVPRQAKCRADACPTVLTDSSRHKRQRPQSFSILRVYKKVRSLNGALNFFYTIAPYLYQTPNQEFLITAVTTHANDVMLCWLNQLFCEVTIKGIRWSAAQYFKWSGIHRREYKNPFVLKKIQLHMWKN